MIFSKKKTTTTPWQCIFAMKASDTYAIEIFLLIKITNITKTQYFLTQHFLTEITLAWISLHIIKWFNKTFCPRASVRCALVASPVNNFAEIVSPVPKYISPANKWKSFVPRPQRGFILTEFWKNFWSPLK